VKEEIRLFPDAPSLARGAAEMIAGTVAAAVASRGRCAVALSGGTTPRLLFRLLAAEYLDRLPWPQVHFFWADERAVPPDHEESNFRMAQTELLARLSLLTEQVHRIRGELIPAAAAEAYEADLQGYFGEAGPPVFDLILLGVGEDGHTASLFPGDGALTEEHRWAVPAYSPATANWRITLTLPVLNNAAAVLFLVSGEAKAGVIGAILGQGERDAYPAGLVQPVRGSVAWLLDQEAAAGLPPPLRREVLRVEF